MFMCSLDQLISARKQIGVFPQNLFVSEATRDNKTPNCFRNFIDLSLCFPIKLQRWGDFPSERKVTRNSTFEGNIYGYTTPGQGSQVTLSDERGHSRIFHCACKCRLEKYEKVSVMWCLSVKSKADKCLVQHNRVFKEAQRRTLWGIVCRCVCVWERGSENVCPSRQCQHSSSYSVLTLSGPHIPQRNIKYICSCWNQSGVVAMSSF